MKASGSRDAWHKVNQRDDYAHSNKCVAANSGCDAGITRYTSLNLGFADAEYIAAISGKYGEIDKDT
jgi:hypothetical protein